MKLQNVENIVWYENQWIVFVHQYLLFVDVLRAQIIRRVVAFEKEHLHDSSVRDSQKLAAVVVTELEVDVLLRGIALVYSDELPVLGVVHEDRSVVYCRDKQFLVRGCGDFCDASGRLAHGAAKHK